MSNAREPISRSMGRTLLGGMLVALDSFAGLTACAGGAALAAGLDAFPLAWLAGTPFANYVAPGLILTGVGGVAAAAAATVLLHPRLGALASTIAGGVLLGWITGEMVLLRQPTTPHLDRGAVPRRRPCHGRARARALRHAAEAPRRLTWLTAARASPASSARARWSAPPRAPALRRATRCTATASANRLASAPRAR